MLIYWTIMKKHTGLLYANERHSRNAAVRMKSLLHDVNYAYVWALSATIVSFVNSQRWRDTSLDWPLWRTCIHNGHVLESAKGYTNFSTSNATEVVCISKQKHCWPWENLGSQMTMLTNYRPILTVSSEMQSSSHSVNEMKKKNSFNFSNSLQTIPKSQVSIPVKGQQIYFSLHSVLIGLAPIQPLIQWVPGDSF
jgi:hypothetical protein